MNLLYNVIAKPLIDEGISKSRDLIKHTIAKKLCKEITSIRFSETTGRKFFININLERIMTWWVYKHYPDIYDKNRTTAPIKLGSASTNEKTKIMYQLGDFDVIKQINATNFVHISIITDNDALIIKRTFTIKFYGKDAINLAENLMKNYSDFIKYTQPCNTTTSLRYGVVERIDNYTATNMYNINTRYFSSIVIDPEIQKKLQSILKSFINSSKIYRKRNIKHNLGILLYGPAGTGKDTLCCAIASHLNAPLIKLDLRCATNLIECRNYINDVCTDQRGIADTIVIEISEIDFYLVGADDIVLSGDDERNKIKRTTLVQNLLELMSGNFPFSNAIFIGTTNALASIEKMDKALLRRGRFSYIIQLDQLTRENAIKLIQKIDSELNVNAILDQYELEMHNDKNYIAGKYQPATIEELSMIALSEKLKKSEV